MSTRQKWLLFGSVVFGILVLDQVTKLYVHQTFALHESRPVIANFFSFTYVRNSGAAFGMLAQQSPTFIRLFFPTVTAVALLGLGIYFARVPAQYVLRLWGLCLIIAGALGNGVDRLWLGQVIDFIDVHWHTYHWPAFNVADSSICIGVGLLMLDAFRTPQT
ncbi:MAG: signal peptidase II [Candidatus Tectomicrobia bacterium]|uniref:Lipoprotein signal peptidase n=1 Tax=Tectimicrobiota bacterium TaxID=2528274 RepID=A0A937W3M1_UNCTE|nr:signal peptidase II [Candidatus Tectomicrobia bacterium]